jgi:glutamate/tyrosine decarboxylase-like PLP-dependent enzyme
MPQVTEYPTEGIAGGGLLEANETLDPADWGAFRMQAQRMLDDMLAYIEKIRERPVWQPIPDQMRARRSSAVPRLPADLAAVHEEFMCDVLPFAAGNVHPGFMGWVHGGGTAVGMLAEMLSAGLNANLGGRDQIPLEVEREVVRWAREIFGFPDGATGLFVTGTSMANLIAMAVARDASLGAAVRARGVAADARRLTAYASAAVHGSIGKAMDICGLGSDALRIIPTDARGRIDLGALEEAVGKDRDAGFSPFLVVGTAGTVSTGAIDDLAGLAEFCARQSERKEPQGKLWFHVDGAYGALARLAPDLSARLDGIERADSLAFDFHKWGQVPYDAGFILVRDGVMHRNAFASPAAYLCRLERGLAGGSPWPCDFGPDLSRGFRALKTWFTLKVYGTDALGAAISRTCRLARYLEERIAATPELELMAPVELNIVCFRYRADEPDKLNEEIVIQLQESGIVAPSTTRIAGQLAIRAAIVNHRTGQAEIDALVDGTLALGRTLGRALGRALNRALDRAPATRSAERKPAAPDGQVPSYESLNAALRQVNQQLATRAACVELLFQRGNLLELMGRGREAMDTYAATLKLEPTHRGALNNMGNLLSAAGKNAEARAAYGQAAASHPGDPMSLVNYANSLRKAGELENARGYFAMALKSDPDYWQAHLGMSSVLTDLGDAERASMHRRAAFRGRCVVPLTYRGERPPIPILELVSVGAGNARIKLFLSDRIFKRYLVTTEFFDADTVLPPHQLVVNAIGDADTAAEALAGAQTLLACTTAPVINAPAAVLATGRCAIASRLAGVPGVVTASTMVFPKALLGAPDALITLTRNGFAFPLLLRAPGFHGGEHFHRVEAPDGLAAALAVLPGSEVIAIEYLDARGRDGKTRKYRVMTIDGELYPLHAAISRQWKIHYFSAEMDGHAEHRAEDAEFLENMAGVLGAGAVTALKAIQTTLGLDYGGIDFGMNERGEILLFEANATMTVFPPAQGSQWDYRRPAVTRICNAVQRMLASRASAGSCEAGGPACASIRRASIERGCVALVEDDGVGPCIKLDGLAPDERLAVVEGGDHKVVRASPDAGKSSAAGGVGADGGDGVGLDGGHDFGAVGRLGAAGSAGIFVGRDALRDGDAADGQGLAVAVAEQDVRATGEGVGRSGLRGES